MQRLIPTTSNLFRHATFAQSRIPLGLSLNLLHARFGSSAPSPPEASASFVTDGLLKTVQSSTRKISVKTPEERWRERSVTRLKILSSSPPRGPYFGRSVGIAKPGGLQDAFWKLDGILARNSVRKELRLTERHEKKGVKRRRLLSERWRKQFANEVRKKVALVLKIRSRGA